ncbi:MAG: GPW/gp25 family protein [Rhodospirillales bacterium]
MPIRQDLLGTGWRFPIRPDAAGGLGYVSGQANVEQSLRILLLTQLQERAMRADFGSSLRDLVFAPSSEQNLRLLESTIRDAVRDWEPRITLLDVAVEVDARQQSVVVVDIRYEIRATSFRGNLVFPFYLEPEGAAL